jgi:hypothetical protein
LYLSVSASAWPPAGGKGGLNYNDVILHMGINPVDNLFGRVLAVGRRLDNSDVE